MKKKAGAFLLLSLVFLFLVLNRGAYQSFFQDDELDNMCWAPFVEAHTWISSLISPLLMKDNFRPVGHFYFFLGSKFFGLHFVPWVTLLHVFHFATVLLIWALARQLGINRFAAAAGTLFFAINMAAFDAIWKPMYVFDVLCTVFCLLSLLLYAKGRWVWSLLAFWLAYKAKELAVMLPVVLLCYELWFGNRRWLRLLPFFLVSLSFGLQGMVANHGRNDAYTFRLTAHALAATVPFYFSRLLLLPYAALALLALPLFVRDRRVWLGLAMMCLFLVPLLFLPGRIYNAYCYLPLTGLTLAGAALASSHRQVFTAVFFLVWLPFNIHTLRKDRRSTLAIAEEAKPYVRAIEAFAHTTPLPKAIVYNGAPIGYASWGVGGAFKYAYGTTAIEPVYINEPQAAALIHSDSMALLSWDRSHHRVHFLVHEPAQTLASYIAMNQDTPIWQLEQGWLPLEGDYRWIGEEATATLHRPANATSFEVKVVTSPEVAKQQPVLTVFLNGNSIGTARISAAGEQTLHFAVPSISEQSTPVVFRMDRTWKSPVNHVQYGLAISSFGFVN